MTPSSDADEAPARRFAAEVLGQDGLSLTAIRRGANARVWRVENAAGRPLAVLKRYPAAGPGGRDRMASEAAALGFLAACGESRAPRLLATDPALRMALIAFVPGAPGPVDDAGTADMEQAAGFIRRLHDYRRSAAAVDLPMAAEACLSAAEILRQVDARRTRLAEAGGSAPALAALLRDLATARDRLAATSEAAMRAVGGGWVAELAPDYRTVSPSDFGFHNSVRAPDGQLFFLDFEYFGWDDPAKLAGDLELHPGMRLAPGLAALWRDRTEAIFGASDPGFRQRAAVYRPLLGLRWTCILLNEFLPERWQLRQEAGVSESRNAVLDSQLEKARAMLKQATLS